MNPLSRENLLRWLGERSRRFQWDCVFALDKTKLNNLLSQEYTRRFNTSSYLPPVTGSIPVLNEYKVQVQDLIMDRPRLSFENASLVDSKARLRMAVVGGSQVHLKKAGMQWSPQRLEWIGPLAGPQLKLDLLLSDVPGQVDEGGSIELDLSRSDNFEYEIADTDRARELGGDFFKKLFRELPDEQRIWQLGRIAQGGMPMLQPQSFKLRTQGSPVQGTRADEEEGEGAVVGFVRMVGSQEGSIPDANSDFRYLIPEEQGKDFSATVLLDGTRINFALLLQHVMQIEAFKDLELEFERDATGAVTGMKAVGGTLVIESTDHQRRDYVGVNIDGRPVIFEVHCRTHFEPLPLKDLLRLDVTEDGVEMTLSGECRSYTELVSLWDSHDLFTKEDFSEPPHERQLTVRAQYVPSPTDAGVLELKSFRASAGELPTKPEIPEEPEAFGKAGIAGTDWALIWAKLIYAFWVMDITHGGVFSLVDRSIRAAIGKDLPKGLLTHELIQQVIRLNFGGAVLGDEIHSPLDIGVFGRVNPRLTTFSVLPLEPLVKQGGELQFFTQPPRSGLQWKVDALAALSNKTGTIDGNTGLYKAPKASDIEGSFTRVRVTATDPLTDFSSSALVTVVNQSVDVSPLVEVVQARESITLKAGSLQSGQLQWSIIGGQAHGRLSESSGTRNTYTAADFDLTKGFVYDQVQVRHAVTGETQTICVVTQMSMTAQINVEHMDSSTGRARLNTNFGDQFPTTWRVLVGDGNFVGSEYRSDPNSTSRFALVEALVELNAQTKFQAFLILPLPLVSFQDTYKMLTAVLPQASSLSPALGQDA